MLLPVDWKLQGWCNGAHIRAKLQHLEFTPPSSPQMVHLGLFGGQTSTYWRQGSWKAKSQLFQQAGCFGSTKLQLECYPNPTHLILSSSWLNSWNSFSYLRMSVFSRVTFIDSAIKAQTHSEIIYHWGLHKHTHTHSTRAHSTHTHIYSNPCAWWSITLK